MSGVDGRAVVLASGGLDSGVALAMFLETGGEVALVLFADYGQLANEREAAASRRLAERFDVPWRRIQLDWLGDAAARAGCALVAESGRALPETTAAAPGDADSAAAVWVPARNFVLLAAAASFAEAEGAGAVVAGFNREEAATFADNSAAFVAAINAALAFAVRTPVTVVSPTLDLDKSEIVGVARRLGLERGDFWSCYRSDSDPATCGCESCVRSRRAWG